LALAEFLGERWCLRRFTW